MPKKIIDPTEMTYHDIAEYYLANLKALGMRPEGMCERHGIKYNSFAKIINPNNGMNFPSVWAKVFTEEAKGKGLENPYLFQEKAATEVGGVFIPPEVLEKFSGKKAEELVEVLTFFMDMLRKLGK